jgi:hypothetical protein
MNSSIETEGIAEKFKNSKIQRFKNSKIQKFISEFDDKFSDFLRYLQLSLMRYFVIIEKFYDFVCVVNVYHR